jgi:hypothetical protein
MPVLSLESAIDSPARSNVCNVENFWVDRENYPIVANPSRSLFGAGQRFRETRVTWLCCDGI